MHECHVCLGNLVQYNCCDDEYTPCWKCRPMEYQKWVTEHSSKHAAPEPVSPGKLGEEVETEFQRQAKIEFLQTVAARPQDFQHHVTMPTPPAPRCLCCMANPCECAIGAPGLELVRFENEELNPATQRDELALKRFAKAKDNTEIRFHDLFEESKRLVAEFEADGDPVDHVIVLFAHRKGKGNKFTFRQGGDYSFHEQVGLLAVAQCGWIVDAKDVSE